MAKILLYLSTTVVNTLDALMAFDKAAPKTEQAYICIIGHLLGRRRLLAQFSDILASSFVAQQIEPSNDRPTDNAI